MATVEMAAALPVLVLLMLAGIYGVQVADARARCADAARETARAAARGDPRAVQLGEQAVDGIGRISIKAGSGLITATVSVSVRPYGLRLAELTVTEQATAAEETADPAPATVVGAGRTAVSGQSHGPAQ